LAIDRKTGLLLSFAVDGHRLLEGGAPNFYRALTDNDIGGGVERTHQAWRRFSQARDVRSVSVSAGPDGSKSVDVDFGFGAGAVRFKTSYVVVPSGEVRVSGAFTPLKDDLPDPLRVGLAFTMPSVMTQVAWYGRGPHETYADRRWSGEYGIWHGLISKQHHDFMRPQETGNKVDVRWMDIGPGDGLGVRVKGEAPLSMNVLAFPYDDLQRRPPGTWRSSDIQPREHVSLMVDAVQTGLGGDDTWSPAARPHVRDRIPLAPRTFTFMLSPSKIDRSKLGKVGEAE
jgi:beta-galactosidase